MKPPKTLYLIPDDEYGYVWCEDPAPGIGMDAKDATSYTLTAELERVKARCEGLQNQVADFDLKCEALEIKNQWVKAENQRLREGIKESIELVEYWYQSPQDIHTWEIYYENSPEMKRLRALLNEEN